jgi:DNA-binding IscR family transcriptional regulator
MGGLLDSVRGRHGGYKLARPVDQISVGEVIAVLGGRVFQPGYCARYPGDRKLCVHSVDCTIRSLWSGLQDMVDRVLSQIKLVDLISTEKGVSEWLEPLIKSQGDLAADPGMSSCNGIGKPAARDGVRLNETGKEDH